MAPAVLVSRHRDGQEGGLTLSEHLLSCSLSHVILTGKWKASYYCSSVRDEKTGPESTSNKSKGTQLVSDRASKLSRRALEASCADTTPKRYSKDRGAPGPGKGSPGHWW